MLNYTFKTVILQSFWSIVTSGFSAVKCLLGKAVLKKPGRITALCSEAESNSIIRPIMFLKK